ncbi:MAG: sulfatase-like hydrolase/transferase [Rhodospirillaceae bacterium]|jgi:phosphoglycerol transferase MdoB-like AlkP superfamily enzyme|nr:sulfatase-like hydrolase/transferase [Rhodospirillaceae bacterium]MBT3493499.1 sulfatase-like hydrolase/transferase [Rhodospirillaceae bacterium]MBT3779013.1 sulfatase-like hydrolase/transferase [Rhodospirillaceae bacterium]MBT3976838.1 sulfatase-like hydrolase/transferase [Rhodospirillaceae bacterium]MBT4168286.1 sulfatase-like hydrolase/transferase [Rhodospirillaceae bacterium]
MSRQYQGKLLGRMDTESTLFHVPIALRLWLFTVFGFTIVRTIIATQVTSAPWPSASPDYALSFLFGMLSDALVAVLLCGMAISALGWIRGWRRMRPIGHGLVICFIFAMIFTFIAEIFFWNEFSERFNGIAIYYLLFPREVIGNLEESFDLSFYLPFLCAAALLVWWPNRGVIAAYLKTPRTQARQPGWPIRFLRMAAILGLATAIIWALPTRSSGNRELNLLAKNGLITLASAALTNDTDYAGSYPTMAGAEAISQLRAIVAQDNSTFLAGAENSQGILRHIDNGATAKRLNIVVVTEESFGSVFVDSLDNRLDVSITPDLDRLAKDGLMFSNIYASGDRTVRGLEATETAFAPIPGIATTRRPGAEGMYSLPHLLQQHGYSTAVLYGGNPLFDNMGSFWRGIGFNDIWGEDDIRHDSYSTIWGVSDEDLFTEALRRMDEETAGGQPVLLTLMTVSNHRPYKFPNMEATWDDGMGRIQNTARYAQWAFVDFVNQARAKQWFNDTVFVFIADHGVKINGAAAVPVHSFRIPMLFYAPAHIKPGRNDTLGAQIDFIPTLMGLLGIDYDSPFFGVDLRRVEKGKGRIAIAHNFSIAYGRPGHLVVLEPNGAVEGYRFTPGQPILAPETPKPSLLNEAIAQTQEAHRMFYSGGYHWK